MRPTKVSRGLGGAKSQKSGDIDAAAKQKLGGQSELGVSAEQKLMLRRHERELSRQNTAEDQFLFWTNKALERLQKQGLQGALDYALSQGLSARFASAEPSPLAMGEGAMLIAQALHQEQVEAQEVLKLLALWQRRVDSSNLFGAAQQLLGKNFRDLRFAFGSPLAILSVKIFGTAHEPGDLFAAGAIVGSIYRKLAFIENHGEPAPMVKLPPPPPLKRKKKSAGHKLLKKKQSGSAPGH